MTPRLAGKTAFVTGAASGFGRGIAEAYRREGAKVVLADINGEGAQTVAQTLGDDTFAVPCDVTSLSDVRTCFEKCLERFGRLDILVNNAGTTHDNGPMLDVEEEEYDRIFAVNVKAIFHAAKVMVPHFREHGGGVILNVTSTAGIRPRPGLTWYNGSKGAANTITRSMAVELAPDRIRVCAIAPVMGETALLERFMGMPDTPGNRAKFIATIPWGRMSRPSDVAGAAVWLASDEAEMMTGTILEVDGGRCV
ncbi:MAG: SDR family oxidoreductase [Pseudomonadota bacterium]